MKKLVIFSSFFLMNIVICTSNIFASGHLILEEQSKAVNTMAVTTYKKDLAKAGNSIRLKKQEKIYDDDYEYDYYYDDDYYYYDDEEVNEQERVMEQERVIEKQEDEQKRIIEEQERIRALIEAEPKHLLRVSKSTHKLTVYSKDSSGNYTVPKAEFVVSTGMSPGMTPVGRFTLGPKEEWHQWYSGGTYSPYTIPYARGLYIHGPIYNHRNFNSIIHSTAADVGQNVTSGCIRSTTEVAKYIFDNCVTGTILEITN